MKIQNFRNAESKLRYAYILTPGGVAAKAELTAGFLKRKIAEYEALKAEIESLEEETVWISNVTHSKTAEDQ